MQGIRNYVNTVRVRQQRQWMWYCLSWGLVGGGIAGCVVGLLRLASSGSLPLAWVVMSLASGPLVGVAVAMMRPRRVRDAAVNNVCLGHLPFQGGDARFDLGQHARGDDTRPDQLLDLRLGQR